MKNLLFLAILMTIVACQSTPEKTAMMTTFSGQVINPTESKVVLSRGDFKQEISLDDKGAFSAELADVAEGSYLFREGNERTYMYIIPGKNIHVTVNTKEFDETIAFSGDGAVASNYLAKKNLDEEANNMAPNELYSREEQDFAKTVVQIRDNRTEFLSQYKDLPASFLAMEKKAIQYDYLGYLNSHADAYAYFSKNEKVPSTTEFLKPLEGIDLDNAADFENISSYRQLVQSKIMEPTIEASLKNLSVIKTPAIINSVIEQLKYNISPGSETLEADYKALHAASLDADFKKELTELCKSLVKGNPSPLFNFEDRNGKMVKLEDLKGKNVYIDVWATWCGPCIREIPDLKKLEAIYHDKNVEFVSISVDKMKDKEKWLKMIEEKELGGEQLFSDKDWKSDFIAGYGINGIPRFILLDDEGKIVSADAPRPSSGEKVKSMIDGLKI